MRDVITAAGAWGQGFPGFSGQLPHCSLSKQQPTQLKRSVICARVELDFAAGMRRSRLSPFRYPGVLGVTAI